MRWVSIYLVGYVIFLGGVVWGLSYAGVLDRIGSTWTAIGILIAIGVGIMLAVSGSGKKETIDIERH